MTKIVASLCDGMSCGHLALDKLGHTDIEYHAFEIDKYADAVSRYAYPDAIRHGDARNWTNLIGKDVYLLMGGFPCQPYSVAGKGKADGDERDLSDLIFDALRGLKPKYFLFENVPMKKEQELRITMGISEALGTDEFCEPIMINSADFSAHNRKRLYWTNIPIEEWEDKGIVLKHIIEDGMVDRDKSYCVDANYFKGGSMKMYYEKSRRQLVFDTKGCHQVGEADLKGYDIIKRVYATSGKSPALTTMQGGHREPKINTDELHWRALSPLECERLQTVPDGYTQYGVFKDKDYDPVLHEFCQRKPISNSQRYKMLGNGWTVNVIAHIMKGME
jgi:site-specific DNA-cytosine methylase